MAWGEFANHYGPMVAAWCRRWGAQEADAEDISQLVLLKLYQKMADLTYDPKRSFRAWLKTITHHTWYDFKKSQQRQDQGTGNAALAEILNKVEARDDLMKQIDEECTKQLLQEAMERVQMRVAPATWEAFRLTALMGLSGAEAGLKLGMAPSLVYLHRHHVQQHLKQEMKRLDGNDGGQE